MGYNSMNGQIVHQVELPCRYVNGELVLDLNNPVVYGMHAKAIRQEPTSYRGEEHDGRSREM